MNHRFFTSIFFGKKNMENQLNNPIFVPSILKQIPSWSELLFDFFLAWEPFKRLGWLENGLFQIIFEDEIFQLC